MITHKYTANVPASLPNDTMIFFGWSPANNKPARICT